jgi:cytochrome bd-type quinol oxidase subunit 1
MRRMWLSTLVLAIVCTGSQLRAYGIVACGSWQQNGESRKQCCHDSGV